MGQPGKGRHRKARPLWAELPALLVIALAVAVVIKSFLIQPFYIPTESMIPTIEINDRVMVSKLTYRFGDPHRGDIVVFVSPFNDEVDTESLPRAIIRHIVEAVGIRTASADDLIKRVVAVGGDEVKVVGGFLHINDTRIDEPYLHEQGVMPDFGPVTVPADSVFVMGDNRMVSYDSRRFGAIPVNHVLGEAVLRIWPLDRFGVVDSVPPVS